MNAAPAVVMMTRAPHPGTTKTRLEPLLGPLGCARLQRALIRHSAATAQLAAPGSLYIAVDPPSARQEVLALVMPDATVFAQQGDDLGARMSAAVTRVFAARPGPLVVIGTDVPALTSAGISEATRLLGTGHDVVFGPALDGGYYLIALARPVPPLFAIDPDLWGGPLVLGASLAAARAAGLRVGFLAPLRDLDTPDDARTLLAESRLPAEISALLTPCRELA